MADNKKPDVLREELATDALRTVLSTRNGRRFVWGLMGECGLAKNPFTGDNNATNFNCGRQSVATELLVKIDCLDPSAFTQMSREAKEDESYVNGNNSGNNGDASDNGGAGNNNSGNNVNNDYNPVE